MAESMRDIKRRIKSITSISHITQAMKLVSSAKLRRAKEVYDRTKDYYAYIISILEDLFNSGIEVPTNYLPSERKVETSGIILITSNRGLAGSFNSNTIRKTEEFIKESRELKENIHLICIGEKGNEYFSKRGYIVDNKFNRPPEDTTFTHTQDISKPIIELYDKGIVDEVEIIWTGFKGGLEQTVKTKKILPFDEDEVINEIKEKRAEGLGRKPVFIDYEPSAKEVFNYLIPKYCEIKIYNAIVESALCEHQARMMAMESATDNAKDMISGLELYYNRARQAAITKEITEIVSGADALK